MFCNLRKYMLFILKFLCILLEVFVDDFVYCYFRKLYMGMFLILYDRLIFYYYIDFLLLYLFVKKICNFLFLLVK